MTTAATRTATSRRRRARAGHPARASSRGGAYQKTPFPGEIRRPASPIHGAVVSRVASSPYQVSHTEPNRAWL